MSAMMLRQKAAFGAAKPASRANRAVRVQAGEVPANVAEAREWIANWKGSKGRAPSNRAQGSPSWYPGHVLPSYLDGSLPGDFGFDPLRLAEDPDKLKWYVQAELMNGRTAMMAVAGILGPELFTNIGIQWDGAGVPWYEAGAFKYFAPPGALFASMMFLSAWVEIRRYQDMAKPGSVNVDPVFPNNKLSNPSTGYPGFDPFGYSKKADFETYKVKEIKNGRLAMLAFLGFVAQHNTTGTTPLANLSAHLADPWNTTVFQNDLARL